MGFRAFLDECGLSTDLPVRSAADASGVVVPLRSAQSAGGDQALSHLLWEQLRGHADPQVLEAVTEGVWEIVGNALEHSGSDAQVTAQVYTSAAGGQPPDHDDRVQVVVGDVGRGIHAAFKATGFGNPPTNSKRSISLWSTWSPPSPTIPGEVRVFSRPWSRCSVSTGE